jgi:hypothetical protein
MSEEIDNYSEQIQDLRQRVELLEERLMSLEPSPRPVKLAIVDQVATIRTRPAGNIPARPARIRSNESGPSISTSKPGPTITHSEE